ncbi:UDP-N-acetylenolpyruvoylglucosamine reductase [Candidatus Ecksteinia adelgidicola]|nr:UDP-N-acetylenolpyruvoylglucosamine reductase [Candidatus Ecksteinia adelgidicola]
MNIFSTNNTSLKYNNTFLLPVRTAHFVIADTIDLMLTVWKEIQKYKMPLLVLGEGSNVLFLENFIGTIMINKLQGLDIVEKKHTWHLHIKSGENWHNLVCYTLKIGIAGLENLALIPGLAGSTPIQNIGAYGIELKNVCEYVDLLNLFTGNIMRIPNKNCYFSYRDSIFKYQFQIGYIIVGIGLCLQKKWKPILTHQDLIKLDIKTVTPSQIFNFICAIRRSKLPDFRKIGNAGSFFKNPFVKKDIFKSLIKQYPNMPYYPQITKEIKLSAAWMIEQCKLKGFQIGGASISNHQALIITNKNNATSQDIVNLARYVRNTVGKKFNLWLEPEVRFIGATGVLDALKILS